MVSVLVYIPDDCSENNDIFLTIACASSSTVYIAVPALSNFQWHPFSLSSAPHQSIVTMHVRVAGNWTAALHKLASAKSEIPILLEGPYGNFGVDVMNEKKYKGKICLVMVLIILPPFTNLSQPAASSRPRSVEFSLPTSEWWNWA